mmetsp:Transcript_54664/g.133974  ORF Transcript_54664/g.133974 Transcript_54664/m.133974 type:complete len:185 (+) Transcript_54664:246-800(+)
MSRWVLVRLASALRRDQPGWITRPSPVFRSAEHAQVTQDAQWLESWTTSGPDDVPQDTHALLHRFTAMCTRTIFGALDRFCGALGSPSTGFEHIANMELSGLGSAVDDSSPLEWNGILLMAVPKKKTTYSKKRKRSIGKALQAKCNILPCKECGRPMLPHRYCIPERCTARRGQVSSRVEQLES